MRREIALLPLMLGLALVAGCDRRKPSELQANVSDAVSTDAAPAQPMGVVDTTHRGEAMPAVPFARADGAPATLATFRGKPLLVNLWATWCGPCVQEMPTLAALARRDDRFHLVVVSQDMQGARAVVPFLAKQGLEDLPSYLDRQNVLMAALKSDTLPTTVLYDAGGKEKWRVVGAMDWTGPRAKKLIDGALGG